MNRIPSPAAIAALALLGGCATAPAPAQPGPVVAVPEGTCNAAPAQPHIGHRATAELGADLLRITGARVLRWVPPRTAVTMDFRADRLTVSYDDNQSITRISCG